MCGGGGRYISARPVAVGEVMKPSGDKTDEKFLSTQVTQVLLEKLKEINAHDYEAIDQHKRAIVEKLAQEYEEVEDVRFGGSHSRSTDVAGLSDVDILVTLGDFRDGISSNKTIAEFARVLKERFPQTQVTAGKMAVTIKLSDGTEVQILPAFKYRDGYRISDPKGSGWITTFPKRFAKQLTEVNQRLSGNVVPVVKLAKEICDARHIDVKSYHLENMALQAFKQYTGPATLPRMLHHLFQQAQSHCLSPIEDVTGQSKYVDEGISLISRQTLAKSFRAVEREIESAINSKSLEPWKKLWQA